jgi:hypothetical protein
LAGASWEERRESAPLLAPSTLTEEEEESVVSGVFSSEPETGGEITFNQCCGSGIRCLFLTLDPESGIGFSGSRISDP